MSEQGQPSKRKGWKRTTLGDALPIRYGRARSEKHGLVREETAVYGSSGVIDSFERALTNGPTLIIGRKGTVGATHYSPQPCWPIDTVYFAEAEPNKDLRFFKYLLDHLQLGRMDRSTAVPGLSRDDYNAKEVLIPLLDEQREIVAEIEKQFTRLDAGVAGLRRVQANLKRYRAALLKAACEGKLVPTEADLARQEGRSYETGAQLLERILNERSQKSSEMRKYKEPAKPDKAILRPPPEGWVWATISQLLSEPLCNGVSIKGSDTPPGVPALRLSAMSDRGFDYTDTRYLPLSESKVADIWVKEGDFFVARGNGSLHLVGRGTPAQAPPRRIIFPDTMIRLRIASIVRKTGWLFTMWPGRLIRAQIEGKVKTTAGIYKIAQPEVEQIAIPLPPLTEQERIIAEVERRLSVVDDLEAVVSANLLRATRLRQSILQQAFEGGLVSSELSQFSASSEHFPIAAEPASGYGDTE